MKAYITSIGEPTTELCKWSLERFDFDVEVVKGDDSLAMKLEYIYNEADDDLIRIDADVIVNKNITSLIQYNVDWWVYGKTFGMYSFDVINGGVSFIREPAIKHLRDNIKSRLEAERPETEMWRLPEFHNPRRCVYHHLICGIHGFGQKDLERVKATKERRGQLDNYDFELAERLQEFYK